MLSVHSNSRDHVSFLPTQALPSHHPQSSFPGEALLPISFITNTFTSPLTCPLPILSSSLRSITPLYSLPSSRPPSLSPVIHPPTETLPLPSIIIFPFTIGTTTLPPTAGFYSLFIINLNLPTTHLYQLHSYLFHPLPFLCHYRRHFSFHPQP